MERMRQNQRMQKEQGDEEEETICKRRQLSNCSSTNSELSTQSRQSIYYQSSSSSSSSREPSVMAEKNIYYPTAQPYHYLQQPQNNIPNYSTSSSVWNQRKQVEEFRIQQEQMRQQYISESQQKQLYQTQQLPYPPLMEHQKPNNHLQSSNNMYFSHQQKQQHPYQSQNHYHNAYNNPSDFLQASRFPQTSLLPQRQEEYIQYLEQQNARLVWEKQQQPKPFLQFTQLPQKKLMKELYQSKNYQKKEERSHHRFYKQQEQRFNKNKVCNNLNRFCDQKSDESGEDTGQSKIEKREMIGQSKNYKWPLSEELIKVNCNLEETFSYYKNEQRSHFYIVGKDASEICNEIQKRNKQLFINHYSHDQYIIGSKKYSFKVNKIMKIMKEYYNQQSKQLKENQNYSPSSLYIQYRQNKEGNNNSRQDKHSSPSSINSNVQFNNKFKIRKWNEKEKYSSQENQITNSNCVNQNNFLNQEIQELKQIVMTLLESQQKKEKQSQQQNQFYLVNSTKDLLQPCQSNNNVIFKGANNYDSLEDKGRLQNRDQQNTSQQNSIMEQTNIELQPQQEDVFQQIQVMLNSQNDSIDQIANNDQGTLSDESFDNQVQQAQLELTNKENSQKKIIEDFLKDWSQQQKVQYDQQDKKIIAFLLGQQQSEQKIISFLTKQEEKMANFLKQNLEKESKYGQEQQQIWQQLEEQENQIKNLQAIIEKQTQQQRLKEEFRSFAIDYIKEKRIQNIKVLDINKLHEEIIQTYFRKNRQIQYYNEDEHNDDQQVEFNKQDQEFLKGIFCDVLISSYALMNNIAQQNQKEGDTEKSRGGGGSINLKNKISIGKSQESSNKIIPAILNLSSEEIEPNSDIQQNFRGRSQSNHLISGSRSLSSKHSIK